MALNNIQLPTLSGESVFTRPLSPADVKSCVDVESAFVERERCSEEKFVYRLNQTPNLCLGLFTNVNNEEQLIGHIIANRSFSSTITDGSMQMPDNWQSLPENSAVVVDDQIIGNDPRGANIAVHSVAISPEYQGKGVGKVLVKAYVEYIKRTEVGAGRIILLCHDYLIPFYESAGFENQGKSLSQFGGGGWFDMVLDL